MPLPVERVRRFNRFYTRYVGALQKDFLESPFSLAEASVLYELAQSDNLTATELGKMLRLDNGYLSRILRDFVHRGLARRKRSASDARQSHLFLTAKGREAFASLDRRQHEKVAAALDDITDDQQARLGEAMRTIETILGGQSTGDESYVLRTTLRPGDIGWVTERQGVLYAREYGWNEEAEALFARILAGFVENFDAKRERCWIAERGGINVGCIFLVKKSATIAQLRLLHVEAHARGHGIGRRLVQECVEFARRAGYKKMILWTNDVLHAARHLYEEAGFRLVKEERHRSFGKDLVGQYWERALQGPV
ncbi:MAG TPA: bifunctional helix-turn-helix transcriptional regulator/GNAT family N-acetyltransferase [Candidatus Baltobacteraceae bacterium]|nr:bifunctional helix-turn-helix transcriptional regulator/GNAT family N-acetyltransferase [Candidatus Baltobacteraceae bacterium]